MSTYTALHGSLLGAPLVEVYRWADAGEPADEFGTIPLYALRLAPQALEVIPHGAEGTIVVPWADVPTAMTAETLTGDGWTLPLPGGIRHRLNQELTTQ